MRNRVYFGRFDAPFWPALGELKPYFLPTAGQAWFNSGGNDTASLTLEGVDGTDHLDQYNGRIDISLQMVGHPTYGVFLFYEKTGAVRYSSKGDMTKFKTYLRTLHDDLRTLAFFIPFDKAWLAVKEFIETDGQLPKSIEWVNMKGLQGDPFPVPHHVPSPDETILER